MLLWVSLIPVCSRLFPPRVNYAYLPNVKDKVSPWSLVAGSLLGSGGEKLLIAITPITLFEWPLTETSSLKLMPHISVILSCIYVWNSCFNHRHKGFQTAGIHVRRYSKHDPVVMCAGGETLCYWYIIIYIYMYVYILVLMYQVSEYCAKQLPFCAYFMPRFNLWLVSSLNFDYRLSR